MVCQHSWNDETVSNGLDGFCYLNDLSIQPNAYSGHVGSWVFKLLLGKCTHTRWKYCCRKYGDGHLNQFKSYGEFVIFLIIYMAAMLVLDFRWSMGIFHYLIWYPYWWQCGTRHKTKSLDSLIRQIFVIEWFHIISMILRSITQNCMDKKIIWDPYCWNCWHRHKDEVSGKLNTKCIRDWVISPNYLG